MSLETENRCSQTCFVHCTTWHYRWPCWRMQSTSVYNRSGYCSSLKKKKKKKKSTTFANDTKGIYSFEMTASILEDKELLCAFWPHIAMNHNRFIGGPWKAAYTLLLGAPIPTADSSAAAWCLQIAPASVRRVLGICLRILLLSSSIVTLLIVLYNVYTRSNPLELLFAGLAWPARLDLPCVQYDEARTSTSKHQRNGTGYLANLISSSYLIQGIMLDHEQNVCPPLSRDYRRTNDTHSYNSAKWRYHLYRICPSVTFG